MILGKIENLLRADYTLGYPPKAVGIGVSSRRRRQGNVVAERSESH